MADKFIREIEEILEKAEKDNPKASRKQAKRYRAPDVQNSRLSGISRFKPNFRVSAGKIVLACLSLLIAIVLINQFLLVSGTINLLFGVGVVFLFLAYLLFFMPSSTFKYEKRWRGQPMEERRSIRERLRRWIRGR
ncbi:MAG: hypothetical protein FJ320_07910 [SAR202 cluster bacterium]|nr:hypothetical protein [SAR202 cluster bacterium]